MTGTSTTHSAADLEAWIESTDEIRARLLAYSKSPIPTDAGERQADISSAIELGQDAGDLLADCDSYLLLAESQAVLAVRDEYQDLSADERKAMVKSRVAPISRLRDGLAVLYRNIKDRRFALMSVGRLEP